MLGNVSSKTEFSMLVLLGECTIILKLLGLKRFITNTAGPITIAREGEYPQISGIALSKAGASARTTSVNHQ